MSSAKSQKRFVFFDETDGKVECRSANCKWSDDCEHLYNHYKEHHKHEVITTDDTKITWKYDANLHEKILLAWVFDTMFWIHTKLDKEFLHMAVQYAECGDFVYNIRVRSHAENINVGKLDRHTIVGRHVSSENIFDSTHFTVKTGTLNDMCSDSDIPEFVLTIEDDTEIENAIAEVCRMYLEDDGSCKYDLDSNVPYECVTFGAKDFKCSKCADDFIHVSQLTQCDGGHSVCPNCKGRVCHVEDCGRPYSRGYKNPAVERALQLFGLEGTPYENC